MKQYAYYTGYFDDQSTQKVDAANFFDAFFLLMAKSIEKGNSRNLETIERQDGIIRKIGDVYSCISLIKRSAINRYQFVAKRLFSDGDNFEDQKTIFTNKYYSSKKWGAAKVVFANETRLATVKWETFITKREAQEWLKNAKGGNSRFFENDENAIAFFNHLKKEAGLG